MNRKLEKHPLIPDSVNIEIPHDREEADAIKVNIRKRLDSWIREFGPWPGRSTVNMKIHSERRKSWFIGWAKTGKPELITFRELYITYNGEIGESIPAYLLIPDNIAPPFPAVVANHQCNNDCDVGKDAVVGKAYFRPDQAYGFELVLRGFVVLAPDSINCGERNIKELREQGEWSLKDCTNTKRDGIKCHGAAISYLSVSSFYLKHLWDATRAVDVLESLDFVDSKRIGMIGHSLGAGTTFWATAFDSRVKASVLSCHYLGGLGADGWIQFYRKHGNGIYYHEMLELIAPRAILATRGRKEIPLMEIGDFESPEDENSVLEWAFNVAKFWCHLYGVSGEKMQVRFFNGGHEFPEAERKNAYRWLQSQLTEL
jgi:dienelactone hydrolase